MQWFEHTGGARFMNFDESKAVQQHKLSKSMHLHGEQLKDATI